MPKQGESVISPHYILTAVNLLALAAGLSTEAWLLIDSRRNLRALKASGDNGPLLIIAQSTSHIIMGRLAVYLFLGLLLGIVIQANAPMENWRALGRLFLAGAMLSLATTALLGATTRWQLRREMR